MADPRHRPRSSYLYGPFVGGPDPLAPPVDLRAALDKIGKDVMEGSSPQQALRELMRQGMKNRRGLDEAGFLGPLNEIADSGLTPADRLLERYRGAWQGDVRKAYEELAY